MGRTVSRRIPRGIWTLGFVSLFMDISSEMIHSLLPIYLVSVLGTSVLTVGVIEGVAEATTSMAKIFSGTLSDYLGKRKLLLVAGYGLAAATKPIFPLAATVDWLIGARFLDRLGKGIREAPRDALIADIVPPGLTGTSFGLRQALDTVGAFLGPLLAIAFMLLLAGNFRTVFWIAVIPAMIAVVLVLFRVEDPERKTRARVARPPLHWAAFRRLARPFWLVAGVGAALTLARFSEAFLVLRAQTVGLPVAWVPLVMVVMSGVYALAAYPAGLLADRMSRATLLKLGCLVLLVSDLVLAGAGGFFGLGAGVALWGLHMGLTQGTLAALVANAAPEDLRGTAFGIFNLIAGVATLSASVLAGRLWDLYGPAGTFYVGAGFIVLTLIGLQWVSRRQS